MKYLYRFFLYLLFFIYPSLFWAQSFSKAIAPQFSWKSQHTTQLPLLPFNSAQILNYHTDLSWAMGQQSQKPFTTPVSAKYFVAPIIQNTHFNTVQGWETSLIGYVNLNEKWFLKTALNYGFADQKLRPNLGIWYYLNPKSLLYLELGNKVEQFNNSPAIVSRANSIASLFLEDNLAKFYESSFLEINHQYSSTIEYSKIQVKNSLAIKRNSSLSNTTAQYFFDDPQDSYFSNNPLFPSEFNIAAINNYTAVSHEINIQFSKKNSKKTHFQSSLIGLKSTIPFAISTPSINEAQLISESKDAYSPLSLLDPYGKSLLIVLQNKQLLKNNKIGETKSFVQLGGFIKDKNIAFVDFKHFNGNQTKLVRGSYLEVFNLLPYYQFSTQKAFAQWHLEQNFKGLLLKKIPLIKHFNLETILSVKQLIRNGSQTYSEIGLGIGNIGFKNNKILRIDYVQSYYKNAYSKGFVVGLVF